MEDTWAYGLDGAELNEGVGERWRWSIDVEFGGRVGLWFGVGGRRVQPVERRRRRIGAEVTSILGHPAAKVGHAATATATDRRYARHCALMLAMLPPGSVSLRASWLTSCPPPYDHRRCSTRTGWTKSLQRRWSCSTRTLAQAALHALQAHAAIDLFPAGRVRGSH